VGRYRRSTDFFARIHSKTLMSAEKPSGNPSLPNMAVVRTRREPPCSLVLLAGVSVTSGSQSPSERRTNPDPTAQAAAVAVLTQTAALRRLRAGDTQDAISLLGAALDSNLVILSDLPSAWGTRHH
jgi:hypothetical protein